MLKIKKILVPTDCSESSQDAIHHAIGIATIFEAEITLLTVTDERFLKGMKFDYFPKDIQNQIYENSKDHSLKDLQDFWKTCNLNYDNIRFENTFGNPFTQIVKYSRNDHSDLIVIGSHGRTDLSHVLIGSVAEAVVRHSRIPVTVVKHESHEFKSVHDVK